MQDAAPAGEVMHNATGGGAGREGVVGFSVAEYGAQERSEMLPVWCREQRIAVLQMQLAATGQGNSAVLPQANAWQRVVVLSAAGG
jgi:hypothetical protein